MHGPFRSSYYPVFAAIPASYDSVAPRSCEYLAQNVPSAAPYDASTFDVAHERRHARSSHKSSASHQYGSHARRTAEVYGALRDGGDDKGRDGYS